MVTCIHDINSTLLYVENHSQLRKFYQICSKVDAKICPWTPNKCYTFQPIYSTCLRVTAIFVECVKRRTNEEFFQKLACILGMAGGVFFNLEYGIPSSIVNMVPFGLDITDLHLCENRNFVLPVNILTLFVHTLLL